MKARHGSFLTPIALAVVTASAQPQIVTDDSFARVPAKFELPTKDGTFEIGDDLGVSLGLNRFHSFSQFNVLSKQTVVFSSQLPLKNILTRVTGGTESVIEGMLESRVEGANLFLINPAGIRFDSGASLQLTGDFSASSADYLAFEDGERFNATNPGDTVLTSAPPSAFGFLGAGETGSLANADQDPAIVREGGANQVNLASGVLRVHDGKSLRLVGGDVEVAGNIEAPGGHVLIAAAKSAGEVPLDPVPGSGVLPLAVQGSVNLHGGAIVDATPAPGSAQNGRVVIRGGRLQIQNGRIKSDSLRATGGMTVDIAVVEDAVISGSNAGTPIQADSDVPPGIAHEVSIEAGSPHEVSIAAGSLTLNGSGISIQNKGAGSGGALRIEAQQNVLLQPGFGTISIDARTASSATGSGATVEIGAEEAVEVRGTLVSLDNRGSGAGATLQIKADAVAIEGANVFVGTRGEGAGGQVILGTDDRPVVELRLAGGGELIADSFGSGAAGKVTVHAKSVVVDSLNVGTGRYESTGFLAQAGPTETASGGQIEIHADQLALSGEEAVVSSSTSGPASGGNISIVTGSLELARAASIRSASSGSGEAGSVTIQARDAVTIRDGGQVLASAENSVAKTLQISAGSQVTILGGTVSAAGARGGEVSVSAGDRIYLLNSMISASSNSETGGNVFLGLPPGPDLPKPDHGLTPVFVILNRGVLNAASGGGVGGNVTVSARYYLPSGDSRVDVTGTEGTGTPSTPVGLDFSGDLATPVRARPEDLSEAKEQKAFAPTDPAGYTPVGRLHEWETSGERRLILEPRPGSRH